MGPTSESWRDSSHNFWLSVYHSEASTFHHIQLHLHSSVLTGNSSWLHTKVRGLYSQDGPEPVQHAAE